MKKVLIIARKYSPVYSERFGGSIESLIRLLISENEKNGRFLITVYSPKIKGECDTRSFRHTKFRIINKDSLKYKFLLVFNGIKKVLFRDFRNEAYTNAIINDLRKRGEENKFDVIIFENMHNDLVGFKKKLKTNSKVVLHLHNDFVNIDSPEDSKKIDESTDEIWAVSQFAKNRIRAILPNKIVKVIPNALEVVDTPSMNSDSKKELKALLDIIAKKTILLYVGRISEEKGVFDAIKALDGRKDIVLLLIGPLEGSAKKYFSKKKRIKNEEKNIYYLGKKSGEEITAYRKIVDIQIVPSKCNETFGLTLLEAMNAQKKIIATTSGALKEVGNDSVVYINPNNIVEELPRAIRKANTMEITSDTYRDRVLEYSSKNFYKSIKEAMDGGDNETKE